MQRRWADLGGVGIEVISKEFSISLPTTRKYVHMTAEEIAELDNIPAYKKRKTVMDDYINIIYKMLRDKIKPEFIMSYVVKMGYSGSWATLENYIKLLAKNNFGRRFSRNWVYKYSYSDDYTVIKRNEILKYMTTKNPKTKKNETVERNFEIIKEKYPIIAVLKKIYDDFYDTIMGNAPEKLHCFVDCYKDSVISGFVDGILNDFRPVKNAVSFKESNGFVEGNNNKFKLIKRILYGRANLDTLFKKAYLAFKINSKHFRIAHLL